MNPEEFKVQVFKTQAQWESGLLYRLEAVEGGITLYPKPAFVGWVQGVCIEYPGGLAVDECGRVYLMDRETRQIYLYDTGARILERISSPGDFSSDSRMIMDRLTLWVLDSKSHRVLGFSREDSQIKYVIGDLEGPVDIALDELGHLYVLDRESHRILRYEENALFIEGFGESQLKEPMGLVVGKGNTLYVMDGGYTGFLVFTERGEYLGVLGDFTKIPGGFQPTVIAVDRRGNVFVGDTAQSIHQFDPDGSYIGKTQIPGFSGGIRGLATDCEGKLYVSVDGGIALLDPRGTFTKGDGVYYSKTLDSGIEDCQWHRLALNVDLPPRTALDVYYYSSDDAALKTGIEGILSDPKRSVQEKAASIDNEIGAWIGPERNPKGMLFREKTGRYLWLKLILSTFDEGVRPVLREMRVYYPRISYLRYLPAVYQEDPISKGFLERFLSLFETVFFDLETEIGRVFEYFDPDTTPHGFLPWLASWLNLALEEDWPEEKKRQFIREASELYKSKGTPPGIRRLVEIYTGSTPLIIEHSRVGRPMVLGVDFRVGVDSLLIETPVRGFRLGDDSILGRVALRDSVQSPEDPFLQMAHRFTIVLDLSRWEFTRYEKGLKRILDEERPAHTAYNLRVIGDMRLGIGTYVGMGKIADYGPIRLGIDAAIGSGTVVMGGEEGGRVERHSRLGKDTKLV